MSRSEDGEPAEIRSSSGGSQPVWRRSGEELFSVDPAGHLRSRSVRAGSDGGLVLGPVTMINTPLIAPGHWGPNYDVAPDGRRIYFIGRGVEPGPRSISFALGWRAMLR